MKNDPNDDYKQRLRDMTLDVINDARDAHGLGDKEREIIDIELAIIGYDLLKSLEDDPLEKEK